MPHPGAVLQVQGLGFAHPKQSALFANWSLALAPGVTWLGGDESTGKTTLLRLLAGRLLPLAGTVQRGAARLWFGDLRDPQLDDTVAADEQVLLATLARTLDEQGAPQAAAQQVRALMFVARFRDDIHRRLDALDP